MRAARPSGGEEVGGEGGEVGGGFAVVEFAEEGGEALDERGFGLQEEMAAAFHQGAGEPDAGGAAADERGFGAGRGRRGGPAASARDEGVEALGGVFDEEEAGDELLLFGGEGHGWGGK